MEILWRGDSLIELEIPVEQIPYIRTIEGRRFKDGKWSFPDSAKQKLIDLGLIDNDIEIQNEAPTEYLLSSFLYGYQRTIVNKALNHSCYGVFADTGTGKTIMGLEIANNYNKILISITIICT